MLRFLIHRALIALLVAITVSIIGFTLLRLSGDLASALAGDTAKPEQIAQTAHLYGLDRPLYVQYLDWVWQGAAWRSRPLALHQRAGGLPDRPAHRRDGAALVHVADLRAGDLDPARRAGGDAAQ